MSRWSVMFKEALAREMSLPHANGANSAGRLPRPLSTDGTGTIGSIGNWQPGSGETGSAGSVASDFAERAAVVEIDAEAPREWAEGFARLQASRPLTGVSTERWRQVIDDAGRFIDRWAAPAAALGWRTLDVFGVHATKPEERFEAAGLVWCMKGVDVLAISEQTATLRLRSGVSQTFRRSDAKDPEAVAIWTLEDCGAPVRAQRSK